MTQFEKTFGNGKPLAYSLEDYWHGVSGEGELGYQWEDKPHRLVFDLIDGMLDARQEIARLKADRDEYRAALENMVVYAQEWHDEYAEKWGVYRKELQDRVQQDINEARELLAGKE